MLSVPEGLRIGASGLAARQLERGDRGSVPASRAFAEIFECEASYRAKGVDNLPPYASGRDAR